MTTKQAIKILRFHNRWRRGEEIPMQEPAKIGQAIDTLCDAVEKCNPIATFKEPKKSVARMQSEG
jgi:hypothetical protein